MDHVTTPIFHLNHTYTAAQSWCQNGSNVVFYFFIYSMSGIWYKTVFYEKKEEYTLSSPLKTELDPINAMDEMTDVV